MNFYTWPLLSVGSAEKGQEEWVELVRKKIDDIIGKTSCRGLRMIADLLARFWDSESTSEDGLEIMLRIGRQERAH